MAIGTRQEPEKHLDRLFKPNSFQRLSRKIEKVWQNRKDRRIAKLNPQAPPRAKYLGHEW